VPFNLSSRLKITNEAALYPWAASPIDGDLHASRSSSMRKAVHHLRRRSIKRAGSLACGLR
jgi:hypothetical protein